MPMLYKDLPNIHHDQGESEHFVILLLYFSITVLSFLDDGGCIVIETLE